MSTEYDLGLSYVASEQSSKVTVGLGWCGTHGNEMGEVELKKFTTELVKVCSYISEDPEQTLRQFNTSYED